MSKRGIQFNTVQFSKPNRNYFDLSYDHKTSLDMGWLVPICYLEVVPGDKFRISCESIIRFMPLVSPVMHRFNAFIHYFFVPYRLLWDGWEDFMVKTDSVPAHPTLPIAEGAVEDAKLLDYLGLNSAGNLGSFNVSALPMSAYQFVYNEYYRDQNLVTEVPYKLVNGNNIANYTQLTTLRKRSWMHDYFTSALPWAQKGSPVELPLGTWAQVRASNDIVPENYTSWDALPNDIQVAGMGDNADIPGVIPNTLYADLSTATAATITDLRRALKLQEWLERNAVAGTRYTEYILAHYGVRSSDARLQRPEYITGVKSPIVISEVLNTTGEDGGLPQGNQSGHGIGVMSGKYGTYFAEEFGCIIGIMSVMPLTSYQQGVPRHFLKTDKFDYYTPEFALIGEQEVTIRELYAEAATGTDLFGYQSRYVEYKYNPSITTSQMKTTLSSWTCTRIFDTQPALNQAFVECTPRKDIFAVTSPTEDALVVHVLNKIGATRLMPVYGTPTI